VVLNLGLAKPPPRVHRTISRGTWMAVEFRCSLGYFLISYTKGMA